jgi:hypothetical protein
MRSVAVVVVMLVVVMPPGVADVVKKDLRSVPMPSEQFVFFCADRSNGVVGLIQGDQASGFALDNFFVQYSNQRLTKRQREAQESDVEACIQGSLLPTTVMLICDYRAAFCHVTNRHKPDRLRWKAQLRNNALV